METKPEKEQRTISETYSYSGKYKMGGECESCPDPPSKGQPVKKQPRNSAEAASKTNEPALAEVQENIIYIISGKSTKG